MASAANSEQSLQTTGAVSAVSSVEYLVKPTALVLDNDFASMEECEATSPDYAQFDFAFVDKNIPDSAWRLDQVIAHLKACGVKKVLVASGESARALANDPLCANADGVIPMKIPERLPA